MATIEAAPDRLLDNNLLFNSLLICAHKAELFVLQSGKHEFSPQGMTAFIILAESHLAIHTYPEDGLIYIDAFTCGEVNPITPIQMFAAVIEGHIREQMTVGRQGLQLAT